jgi:hypothetical protein
MAAISLKTILVEKTGTLKETIMKDFKIENLYKKCGFKTADNFDNHVEWKVKIDVITYYVNVYGKSKNGKANCENKFDFPPPIDKTLFFGNCIIVAYTKSNKGEKEYADLSLSLWNSIYEKLFGGFEDLSATAKEDEDEEDELEKIPKEKKTKDGYLKDGFVVESSDNEDYDNNEDDDDTEDDDDDDNDNDNDDEEEEDNNESTELDDAGSELSEEQYIDEE